MSVPPQVTVLMAVHNGVPHLAKAVESLLRQTLGDFEIVVVDDGSTDGTREVVASYADPRIRLVVNDRNLGLAASLNRGLSVAAGEYVARLDADDLSDPTRLERQAAFLDANPDVALVGAWHRTIDTAGTVIKEYSLPCTHADIRWALLFYCPFVHSAVMWRRQRVEHLVGGYDETLSYSMDYELWSRIARRMPVANLPERLVSLRVHPASLTSTAGDRTREGYRMRVAEAARMLAWPDPAGGDAAEGFDRVYALLFGDPRALARPALERAVCDVEALHRVFARESGLPAEEARQHRASVFTDAGRRLLGFSRSLLRRGEIRRARDLFLLGTRCRRLAAGPPTGVRP
jgi:hypothetical protein